MTLTITRAKNDEILSKLQDIIESTNHQIPYYAYGDNEAACEMSHLLKQIQDNLIDVYNQIERGSAMKLEITRTVEPDGTWIRVLKDKIIQGTFREDLDGLVRAKYLIAELKGENITPEVLYSEEVPDVP